MTYSEVNETIKKGKVGKLPHFQGYFKWNYSENKMWFQNGDFECPADQLDIQNRTDFYYII